METFNKMIIKIGEELGVKVTLLSDEWTKILEKDNKTYYIKISEYKAYVKKYIKNRR